MILPHRKLTTAVVSLAIVIGSAVAAAPASSAPSGCPVVGLGCTYEDSNYGGGRINFYEKVPRFAAVGYWAGTLHVKTNDAGSSGFNRGTSGAQAHWYEHDNYRGVVVSAKKNTGVNFSSKRLNDKISSACFAGYCK
jgi:hypothetical protein